MSQGFNSMTDPGAYLEHHGIKGQKWGERRYQNEDGSWTTAGRERYGKGGAPRATLSDIALAIGPSKKLRDAYPTRNTVDLNRSYVNHSPGKKTSLREKIDYAKTKRLLSEEVDWIDSDAIAWEKDNHPERNTSNRKAYLDQFKDDVDDLTSEQYVAGFGIALMKDLGIKGTEANMTEVANHFASHVQINDEMLGINIGTVEMNTAYHVYKDMAFRMKVRDQVDAGAKPGESKVLDNWLKDKFGTEIEDIATKTLHSMVDSDSYYDYYKNTPEYLSDQAFGVKAYEALGYHNAKQKYESLSPNETLPDDVGFTIASLRRLVEERAVHTLDRLDKLHEKDPESADIITKSFRITADPANKKLNFEQLCRKIQDENAGHSGWNSKAYDLANPSKWTDLDRINRDFAKRRDEYDDLSSRVYSDVRAEYNKLKTKYEKQGLAGDALANKMYKQLMTLAPDKNEYPSLYAYANDLAFEFAQLTYDEKDKNS